MPSDERAPEEAKLDTARRLMGEKRYAEAKAILRAIRHHPQAQSWLETIDVLAPQDENTHRSDVAAPSWLIELEQATQSEDDPYGQDEFVYLDGDIAIDAPKHERAKVYTTKRKHAEMYTPGEGTRYKNYFAIALVTWILYAAIWPVGLVVNLMYLREARQLQAQGAQVQGLGCLWVLIVLNVIPVLVALVVVVALVSA